MIETTTMFVIKRTGAKEPVAFEKVQDRITKAADGLAVNAVKVAQGVLTRIIDGITTTELDTIAANLAFSWSTTNPDYATLAARIAVSNHQRNTPATMLEVVNTLDAVLDRTGKPASLLDPVFVATVRENAAAIEARIDYGRDYLLDFFGFKTLERAYLLRDTARKVVERPQHLWMRVALGIWPHDLPRAFEMYDMMSQKKYTHATPTLFNAGTKRPQLSSCFLLAMKGDSIHGIYDTLKDCALISQYGGGIGIHMSNIRARGSLIRGTGGTSNGIMPMLRVYNNTARYVDQCFVPETLVAAEEGAKPIKDVKAGERIQTSKGLQRVNALVEHDWSGPMLRVTMHQETPGGTAQLTVQVTAEHPVLALQNTGGDEATVLEAKYRAGLVDIDYIEVGALRVGDLIASPRQATEDNPASLSFHSIEVIEDTTYEGKVYDFEVDEPHDYHVIGLGIAHNGGGKRNGSFAMYLEPWHADVEDFLEMKKNTGAEEERARDLFYGLWVPDLFMERVDAGGDWTLFCPNEAPGLADAVGPAFKALYERYEAEGRGRRVVKAQDLWFRILDSQIETGTPYLLYKDAANRKSNQQNLGTIKSSNLCVAPETLVLTREGEFPIETLCGEEVEVWNGDRWSRTQVQQTGRNQRVITVDVTVGIRNHRGTVHFQHHRLECTPYHKFLIHREWRHPNPYEKRDYRNAPRAEAKDLRRGDILMEWRDPTGVMLEAVVWDVIDEGRHCDTYCFNEPLNHTGVFNGILTGNCTEIIEFSSPEETAVCNLASLSLPAFVKEGVFDFTDFRKTVKVATTNLNRVIDANYYPIPEAERSNLRHRPIGLGVQGLADVFAMLGLAWEDKAAADLNRRIFAHMYYAACEASCDLAAKEGPYETWWGSPAQKGQLQFDLWGQEPERDADLDWDGLANAIRRIGMRNSLLVAPMPTASTSQILGNCECFEPYATHIFTRRTLAGEFIVINRHLVKALQAAGVWSETLKDMIIANNGSVQGLAEVPEEIQRVFKTVWEIKQKTLIDMAADRGPYICQSQSLNLFLADADYRKLTSMHFYAWRRGLKTGIYYLRTRAAAAAQKFTVDPNLLKTGAAAVPTVPSAAQAECLMCSS